MYLGISVIPHLDDWLVHHPDHKVLLCHFVSATKHARLNFKHKLPELYLMQDIQFLSIRLRLDLGKPLLPESKSRR